MVIVQINQTYKIGSTGKIMNDLNQVIQDSGHESYMIAGYSNDHSPSNLLCANKGNSYYPIRKDQVIFRLTGRNGYRYKKRTHEIIEWIDSKHPDIIHLHNIHGDWINLEILFDYIQKKGIPVVWTLHDCWAFTGRCSHFELCGCQKWKSRCYDCKNKKVYPISYLFDKSEMMFEDKKRWFTKTQNMVVVTPSQWLAEYVKSSFLSKYSIKVVNNGIDTSIFNPRQKKSNYYKDLCGKRVILGVASSWSKTKGLDDFVRLNQMIDHSKYQIVLVGLNKRQMKKIPPSIIGISRTNNQNELAELYAGAYVFLNLTYQDNYPTTNLEAISCGTPVITYNTGGCSEAVKQGFGYVVESGDIKTVYQIIDSHLIKQVYDSALTDSYELFDKDRILLKYIEVYDAILK